MTEITDEQRAAIEWLQRCADFNSKAPAHGHARVLLATLPDALTNPQPALPTEPGWYLDSEGDVWRLKVDQWWRIFDGEPYAAAFAPFTRLVPERPQVTGPQVRACVRGNLLFAEETQALVNLANGTPA